MINVYNTAAGPPPKKILVMFFFQIYKQKLKGVINWKCQFRIETSVFSAVEFYQNELA